MTLSKNNPLIKEVKNLLYIGNDHFKDKDGNLYAVEEVFAPLNRAKEDVSFVEYGSSSKNGGYHYYDYENSIVGNYELVVPNQYKEVQQACDEQFQLYKEICKSQGKTNKIILIGGATLLTLSLGTAAIDQMKYNHQANIEYLNTRKDRTVSAIEVFLINQRNALSGTSALTHSPFNMNDETIELEAEAMLKVFKTKYSPEELDQMVSNGVLTDFGKQAILKYFDEKVSLYTTEIHPLESMQEQANINVTVRTK